MINFLVFIIGILIGYFLRQILIIKKEGAKLKEIEEELELKRKEAESILAEAREKSLIIIEEAKKEKERILEDILEKEKRISQKENILDEKEMTLIEKEKDLIEKNKELEARTQALNEKEKFLEKSLEKISGFTKEEALKILFQKIEKENEVEIIERLMKLKQQEKEKIEAEAKKIILEALPRYARSVVNEITTTVVNLPNEEMKGRIIGKEGRNIKHFENLTGVEIIIDETPDVVVLSSFDPVKREIARLALEKLMKDGRINPVTIEEKVAESKEEIEKMIEEAGRNAAYEVGLFDLPEEIILLMGRLKFRYSYGQNVLQHSIEMAYIAKMIAEELGLDPYIAKKAAFLHDIGKAVTHDIEGSHLEIGIRILEKYGIEEEVILGMRSHHETYPFANPYAYIVLAADILSGARPGARRETVEIYLQRLQQLEKIASSFEGVEKCFATAGGRELRVFVKAELVSDLEIYNLAKEIAKKIEKEVKFPGEIKVVVIRENRAVEYAR
ncbi:MAG: ribonuclease Y [Candidatus Parcubacteria bacterium]|nr:MAG: ribonuclease Y [Candidatus Parcubacteria bacterium]